MAFRINRGIFQFKDAATEAFVNKFKIDDRGDMVEVDADGNAQASYMKIGDKATDSDKVDGIDSSAFIRSNADDNITGHTEWQDGYNVRLGNGADFRMWHSGNHTYFRNYNHAYGNMYWQAEDKEGTNHAMLYMISDVSSPYVRLFENGGERLRTVSDGVRVYNNLRIEGSTNNGRLYSDEWGVKVGTDSGYIPFGPANSSWAHIYTDRDAFYTNKAIYENGARLATQSYAVGQKNDAVAHADGRIDGEVIPYIADVEGRIPTNTNQLTNGAGFLTGSNDRVYISDTRGARRAPSYYNDRYAQFDFQNAADTEAGGDSWHALLTVSKWSSFHSSHRQEQLIFTGDNLKRRTATSDSAWGPVKTILDTGNFNPNDFPEFIGPKGDKGDRGAAGTNGTNGTNGAKGDKGDKGDTGARGPQGATGPAGATGATGATGARGATGSRGPQGATGPQGPAGANGIAPAFVNGEPSGQVVSINFNLDRGNIEFTLDNGQVFNGAFGR